MLAGRTLNKQQRCCDKTGKEVALCKEQCQQQEDLVRPGRDLSGDLFADEEFWQQDREQLHLAAPWLGPKVQEARSEVFSASLGLHKAFIDAAAYPMRHNLALAMQQLRGNCLPDAHRNLVTELWSSLFLVVPVVSSTFASIERMFKNMPPEALGWLFIDEAGQASPQAAVGALVRSKRALVLGDPKQIEPIATLAPKLVKAICHQWGVNHERWTAPISSVQICADQNSRLIAQVEDETSFSKIGFPLLVHRRCENPMFEISNKIAYDNLMISATAARESRIRDILGTSQ